MLSGHHTRSLTQIENNKMELIEELTKLNASLKLEIQKCHNYIDALKKDLNQAQNNNNISVLSQRLNITGGDIQQQNIKLKQQVQRLSAKLLQKRTIIKKLQNYCQESERNLNQTLKQKQELQISLSNISSLPNRNSSDQKQKKISLEEVKNQKQNSIQLCSRQIHNETDKISILEERIRQLQKQLKGILRENEDLKQITIDSNQRFQELQKIFQYKQIQRISQIRQLETKNQTIVNEINKLNTSKSRNTVAASSVLTENSCINPISKRSTLQQNQITKKVQQSRQQLMSQICILQQENQKQKQKVQMLKNNLIIIKLQHSNLLSTNQQLTKENTKLERLKNQLSSKLQCLGSIRAIKQTQRSYQAQSINSLKSSCNRTLTTIGSSSIRRLLKTPEDGQIPVHDKGYVKGQYAYITNSAIDSRKNIITHRQSTINLTSLR